LRIDTTTLDTLASGIVGGRGLEPRARSLDRRGDSQRGILAFEEDLQSLLAGAVQRLAATTGAGRVAAWSLGEDGVPVVRAAQLVGSALLVPREGEYAAVAALPEASDLEKAGLTAIVERHGFTAAAPVSGGDAGATAVLLLGEADEAERPVRPRILAELGSAAQRLRGPAAAALAANRLQQLDAEVRRLDRLAALGGLVAEIVHEIRNPLVSVKTFLQLLPERQADPEFRESFLEVASDEVRRIERLLDAVLQHGRPAPPIRADATAAVTDAFESVVQLVGYRAAERGVRLEIDAAPELPEVRIAPDALRQVVLNLSLNAIDATRAGGCVRLRAQRSQDWIAISVADEGAGIPPELASRIFEPFVSTKQDRPGGLGLAITRRIVEEARGTIRVEAYATGGAVFTMRLPAV
jgi:signal transduction histidine kinase